MNFLSSAGVRPFRIGVISDTHGVLLAQAIQALQDVELIIHAGDAEAVEVLDQLEQIAPVHAVRGNVDNRHGLEKLPNTRVTQVGDKLIYTIHDLVELDLDPAAAGFRVVIHGHYHRAEIKERKGVLYINPGSASFPRMGSAKSLALLHLENGTIDPYLKTLD